MVKWIGEHIWDLVSRFRNKIIIESATGTAAGSGVGDADTAPEIHVAEINGVIETLIYFDVDGLKSGDTQHDVIGDNGETGCYLTRLTNAINGHVVRAQLHGIEQTENPTGSNPREIDVWAHARSDLEQDTTANQSGSGLHIINTAADISAYGYKGNTLNPIGDLNNAYIYISVGHSSPGTAAVYTAGKYMLKFTGIKTTY